MHNREGGQLHHGHAFIHQELSGDFRRSNWAPQGNFPPELHACLPPRPVLRPIIHVLRSETNLQQFFMLLLVSCVIWSHLIPTYHSHFHVFHQRHSPDWPDNLVLVKKSCILRKDRVFIHGHLGRCLCRDNQITRPSCMYGWLAGWGTERASC